jgi:polysaccharide pyruvyl transferase WcaK-like protein
MSVQEELGRMTWRLRSYARFFHPQLAVMGWFSHHNLGDDAAEFCFNRFFDNKLVVITPQTYRRIPSNLKLLICGGGGWLNRDAPLHFLKYIRRIKNRSFPCLFLAGGINRDYTDRNYQDNYPIFREFMSHFDYVAARDAMSSRLLEKLGVVAVKIMPDIVLSLPDDNKKVDSIQKRNLKTLGLVLATHNQTVKNNFDRVYPFLFSLCESAVHRGYKIVCIPFQVDASSSRDKGVDEIVPARKLQQDLNSVGKNCEVIGEMMSVTDTLSYIKHDISVVVSMRLHGNVMAAAAGVPFISLSYNDKHAGFLEMMDMMDYDTPLDSDILDSGNVMDLLDFIEANYDKIFNHIKVQTEFLKRQTREQIEDVRSRYLV